MNHAEFITIWKPNREARIARQIAIAEEKFRAAVDKINASLKDAAELGNPPPIEFIADRELIEKLNTYFLALGFIIARDGERLVISWVVN